MKSLIFVLMALSMELQADCVAKLLNDYSLDSQAFHYYHDEVADTFDSSPRRGATAAVLELTRKLECDKEDDSIRIKEVSCQEMSPGKYFSVSCYVETTYGYFFVSKDMMEKVNLIYNRFD